MNVVVSPKLLDATQSPAAFITQMMSTSISPATSSRSLFREFRSARRVQATTRSSRASGEGAAPAPNEPRTALISLPPASTAGSPCRRFNTRSKFSLMLETSCCAWLSSRPTRAEMRFWTTRSTTSHESKHQRAAITTNRRTERPLIRGSLAALCGELVVSLVMAGKGVWSIRPPKSRVTVTKARSARYACPVYPPGRGVRRPPLPGSGRGDLLSNQSEGLRGHGYADPCFIRCAARPGDADARAGRAAGRPTHDRGRAGRRIPGHRLRGRLRIFPLLPPAPPRNNALPAAAAAMGAADRRHLCADLAGRPRLARLRRGGGAGGRHPYPRGPHHLFRHDGVRAVLGCAFRLGHHVHHRSLVLRHHRCRAALLVAVAALARALDAGARRARHLRGMGGCAQLRGRAVR